MTGTFKTTDGAMLAVHTTGAGQPFLFQHGLCGDARQIANVFPAEAGFRAVTVECRGHGSSDPGSPDRFSLRQFADDLIAFMETRLPAPVPLGGISMGAALSLQIAVRRPDLVSALVLARPAWLFGANPENLLPNREVGRLLTDHPPDAARALFEASQTARNLTVQSPDNLASLRGFFARPSPAVTAALLTRIARDDNDVTAADLAALDLPVLVIATARDAIHPLALARDTAGAIPGAQMVEIPPKDSGGDGYSDGFRAAVSGFLSGLPEQR